LDDLSGTAISLTEGWRLTRCAAAAAANPREVEWSNVTYDAMVPGTVAASLIGKFDADRPITIDYDDFDWWYECEFDLDLEDASSSSLVFDGLATIAEVWLNGEKIHRSRNMFRAYRIDISELVNAKNTLSIVFRSINLDLKQKRPRPRWKTNLVSRQQLRWVRTTLLGRIPGWTPAIAPVGPWQDVRLESYRSIQPVTVNILPSAQGSCRAVSVSATLERIDPLTSVDRASLTIKGQTHSLRVRQSKEEIVVDGEITVGDLPLWFPGNPGSPALHEYSLAVQVDGRDIELQSGKLGFREIDVDRSDGQLAFRVNGQAVFCRGACWTTNDIASLVGNGQRLADCLRLFRDAGGNMIRIGGTMVYESETFYELCDELGILVWQDFMFANMDYPSFDTDFLDDAKQEITQQIRRLQRHPCVVAFCGNSEVEQQSAMFGMTPDLWRNDLFYEVIPALLEELWPGVPYFPSSPCEGAMPFHNTVGPSHFFGVGAYKQPLAAIESAKVKFSSECLAFSNVPSDRAMIGHFATASPAVHQPRWKAGVPRDSAAGWDFEDIRDHYIRELYGVDPTRLRYADKERYIAISQVVTGEVIEHVFNYWRGPRSQCSGGLIWQLKDIVPGAGWGFIDSDGHPKPLYHFLKRCWENIRLTIGDCGLDGLELSIDNETSSVLHSTLNVQVLQHSSIELSNINQTVKIAPNERVDLSLDAMLGRFFDTTYQYRFGPPKHDVVIATLLDDDRRQALSRCYFPGTHNIRALDHADVSVECTSEEEAVRIRISSDCFLQHVKLYSRTHEFDDNYFHLAPGFEKELTARPIEKLGRPLRGVLSALNLTNSITFR